MLVVAEIAAAESREASAEEISPGIKDESAKNRCENSRSVRRLTKSENILDTSMGSISRELRLSESTPMGPISLINISIEKSRRIR